MAKKYDFAGWATKNDVRCADGRIIRKDAFIENDGKTVPLFWNHQHGDPEMVLGHALLLNKEDGVYAYGSFNNSAKAQHVKESIAHGDLLALSIYANQLKQNGDDVIHGIIRELSVVPGGANPDALIETAMLAHGDLWSDEVMIIDAEEDILAHSAVEEDDEEVKEVEETEEKKEEVEEEETIAEAESEETPADEAEENKEAAPEVEEIKEDSEETKEDEDKDMKHSATEVEEKTVGDVLKTLNEEQKKAVAVLIDAISNEDDEDEDAEETEVDEEEEDSKMKHNVFDNEANYGPVLSHSDMEQIFADWKRNGSLAETVRHHMEDGVLAHTVYNHNDAGEETTAQTYGMADVNYLFPEARAIGEPDLITRQMDWVKKVMNGVRHTPFSRVKSIHANITMDEARAKGYVKGNRKSEEVFALLKRVTTPQTIYKKQKLDKDDILDITDFSVVSWIKAEMRLMLEEECARAILIGDGRSSASSDKISEDHIRPVASDAALYTIKVTLDSAADAKSLIRAAIQNRKSYKGSGNLTMFTTANWHTEMVLLEDQMGRPLYDTDDKLRTKLRVTDIVDVEPMEGVTDDDDNELVAVLVDLRDYNVGADKGGQTEFFEDFDIDYNQEKYLLETRFSGALVKPYSAIAIYKKGSSSDSDSDTN